MKKLVLILVLSFVALAPEGFAAEPGDRELERAKRESELALQDAELSLGLQNPT